MVLALMEQVKREEEKETKIVLTKPLTIEKESDSDASYKAPNFLQRILSLFKNVRPGSDLTRFQVRYLLSDLLHYLFIYFSLLKLWLSSLLLFLLDVDKSGSFSSLSLLIIRSQNLILNYNGKEILIL